MPTNNLIRQDVMSPGCLTSAALGGTIYDFATENIYKTNPNYQKKYPDKQKQ